jgi:hypothetical protein
MNYRADTSLVERSHHRIFIGISATAFAIHDLEGNGHDPRSEESREGAHRTTAAFASRRTHEPTQAAVGGKQPSAGAASRRFSSVHFP